MTGLRIQNSGSQGLAIIEAAEHNMLPCLGLRAAGLRGFLNLDGADAFFKAGEYGGRHFA